MATFHFELRTEIDKRTGTVLAAYLRVRSGKSALVKEFADGSAFADYNKKGQLLGIELLGPCEITVLDQIAAQDEPGVKRFLRTQIPRKQAWAALAHV